MEHEDEFEDWSASKQLEALFHFPIWGLYKAQLLGLGRLMGYTGRKVAPHLEVPALSYEPFIRPIKAPECEDVPAEGTIFHYSLRPRTQVPTGCTLWINHVALDRCFPFTIPLNQLKYLSVGYLFEVVLP